MFYDYFQDRPYKKFSSTPAKKNNYPGHLIKHLGAQFSLYGDGLIYDRRLKYIPDSEKFVLNTIIL